MIQIQFLENIYGRIEDWKKFYSSVAPDDKINKKNDELVSEAIARKHHVIVNAPTIANFRAQIGHVNFRRDKKKKGNGNGQLPVVPAPEGTLSRSQEPKPRQEDIFDAITPVHGVVVVPQDIWDELVAGYRRTLRIEGHLVENNRMTAELHAEWFRGRG